MGERFIRVKYFFKFFKRGRVNLCQNFLTKNYERGESGLNMGGLICDLW